MISGHSRKRALEVLMMYNVDDYIYDLSNDVATIMMVDSNLHRENIIISIRSIPCWRSFARLRSILWMRMKDSGMN